MAQVILMRHGETPFNVAHKITGRGSDPSLTENGINQAKKSAIKLYESYGSSIDFIVSSGMTRTNQTAEIVNSMFEKPIYYDIEIQEISHGAFEGMHGPSVYHILDSAPDEVHPAGGESRSVFAKRVGSALCKYLDQDAENILLVSHGRTGMIAHEIFFEQPLSHFGNSDYIVFNPFEIDNLEDRCIKFLGEQE